MEKSLFRRDSQRSKLVDLAQKVLRENRPLQRLDFIKEAKKLKIATAREAEAFLSTFYPWANTTPRGRRRRRGNNFNPIRVSNLGHYQFDIFFLNQRVYQPPRTLMGIFLAIDVLSKRTFLLPLYRGRTATILIKAVSHLLRRVNEEVGSPVLSLSSDLEPAARSRVFRDYVAEKGIGLHFFVKTRKKAMLAEGAIRQIRQHFSRLRQIDPDGLPFHRRLTQLEEIQNSKRISFGSHLSQFTPQSITNDNVEKFLNLRDKLSPHLYMSHFSLDSSKHKFSFEIGDKVRLRLGSVGTPKLGQKLSDQNLSNEVYRVTKRFLYLTSSRHIGEGYLVVVNESLSLPDVPLYQPVENLFKQHDD